jgi:hypothetical protein
MSLAGSPWVCAVTTSWYSALPARAALRARTAVRWSAEAVLVWPWHGRALASLAAAPATSHAEPLLLARALSGHRWPRCPPLCSHGRPGLTRLYPAVTPRYPIATFRQDED